MRFFALASSLVSIHMAIADLAQDLPSLFTGSPVASEFSSYNSLTRQTAACKLQGFDTVSRNTSGAPPMMMNGNVKFLVGLSTITFGHDKEGAERRPSWSDAVEGQFTCGLCLEVLRVDNMPRIEDELTSWDWSQDMATPFVVAVADSCSDPICQTSPAYLDFDVYSDTQPVDHGNPRNTVVKPVPCPVGDTPLEILFCTSDSCNAQNPEGGVGSFLRDRMAKSWILTAMFRNQRLPLIDVRLENLGETASLQYVAGLGYLIPMSRQGIVAVPFPWTFEVTAFDGAKATFLIQEKDLDRPATPGYRGGIVVRGQENV